MKIRNIFFLNDSKETIIIKYVFAIPYFMTRQLFKKVSLAASIVLLASSLHGQVLTKHLRIGIENYHIKPLVGLTLDVGYLGTPIRSIKNIPVEYRTIDETILEPDHLKRITLYSAFYPSAIIGGKLQLGPIDVSAYAQRKFLNRSATKENEVKTYSDLYSAVITQEMVRRKFDKHVVLGVHIGKEASIAVGASLEEYMHRYMSGSRSYHGQSGFFSNPNKSSGRVNESYYNKYELGELSEKKIYVEYRKKYVDIPWVSIRVGVSLFDYERFQGEEAIPQIIVKPKKCDINFSITSTIEF
jgi:hypothetical protein